MISVATNSTFERRDALFQHIVEALEEMPADLREAFVLSHYERLSTAEIARRMSRPQRELVRMIGRANRIFFRHLNETGGVHAPES